MELQKKQKTQINPYLIFDGNCRAAMTFYQECFGGTLTLQSVEDSPTASQWPKAVRKNVLHASLIKGNLTLLATDMAGPDGTVRGNSVCLALMCSSREEIEIYFANLSIGGKVNHPLHEFSDGMIGGLTDRFGTTWVLKL